jgi:polyvinyl alcohol dehydrogenase (cytochrome)
MIRARVWLPGIGLAIACAGACLAQTPAAAPGEGERLFNAQCKSCHDPAIEHAPTRAELAVRPREDIVAALTNGKMVPMAQGLNAAQIQAIASFLVPPASAAAPARPGIPIGPVGNDKKCETNPPIQASSSDWSSMGLETSSNRYQKHPGLSARDVPRLKVKWAFALAGGGQPIVVGDWLFTTNRGGKFYALDAKTGCVHWATDGVASRTTPMVIRSSISPSGWATFIGTANRIVRAFDAQSGKEIWHSDSLESHRSSNISGAPAIFEDQIFVPLSSGEEAAAIQKTYACCTFRGSLAALDLKTGQKQWQTYMIEEPLHPTHTNEQGVQMQGPAGAAVWASPTVDPKRHLVYVVTGDSYTEAPTVGDDAVVAIEMKTGKVRWKRQVTTGDNFVMGCTGATPSPNCPSPVGPDFDFGASAILFARRFGGQILIAGQKSGLVYGLDPDDGRLLWTTRVGEGSALGGVEWGIASDDKSVYVPNSDIIQLLNAAAVAMGKAQPGSEVAGAGKPGLTAIDPTTGKIRWQAPAPAAPCHYAGDRSRDYAGGACIRAQSAAPAVIPGLVLSGTLDGWLRAYDASTGKIVWEFSTTAQTYDTVNGVKGQPGGGIDGMGPTLAGGMLYTMSGFNGASRTGGNGTNVLLAFSVDGR